MTDEKRPFAGIHGLTAEQRSVLAENGITTLEQLRDADPIGVAALFEWVSHWTAGQWQAQARTILEAQAAAAGKPSPAKWFIAVQPLSVEAVVPNYEVPSGEPVNLWFRSDEHLARLVAEKVIAPKGEHVHLLARAEFLPVSVIHRLAEGGIYTVEAMLAGPATLIDQEFEVKKWLGALGPEETIEGWLDAAREYLKTADEQAAAGEWPEARRVEVTVVERPTLPPPQALGGPAHTQD